MLVRKTAGSCAATIDVQANTSVIAARVRVSTCMRCVCGRFSGTSQGMTREIHRHARLIVRMAITIV